MTYNTLFGPEEPLKQPEKHTLQLIVPNAAAIKHMRESLRYQNKDFFWHWVKRVIEPCSKFAVEWVGGTPGDREKAMELTRTVLGRKSTALKGDLENFYLLIFGLPDNVVKIAETMMTPRSFDIAKKIVDEGALCLADLADMMSWPAYNKSHWGRGTDEETYRRWIEMKDTAGVSLLTHLVNGAPPYRLRKRSDYYSYYYDTYPYIIPQASLIRQVIDRECPTLEVSDIADPKQCGLTPFSGADLLGSEGTLQNLIVSGVIAPGKTKIGVNVVKKFNSYIPLAQFPENAHCVMSRGAYVANASLLTFGEPSNIRIPSTLMPDSEFLKKMFRIIRITTLYYAEALLSGYIKGVDSYFIHSKSDSITVLFNSLTTLLAEVDRSTVGGWVTFSSLLQRANCLLAASGRAYIYPDRDALNPERVRYADGNLMPPSEFKENIHDILLRAMVEGMAAVGAVDLLFDEKGFIAYVRMTEAGKWYLGLSDTLPDPKLKADAAEAIEVDDNTGLILVKSPGFPYLNALPEFADKITDTRYCISEKAFLKKCSTPSELEAKIKRFHMFILPTPGPNVQKLLDRMLQNCDLVKKSAGGSKYRLYSVNPKNERLHALITSDKEIAQNTLRVEGCRLLIKTDFLPRFTDILAAHGFLTNLQ